MKHFLFALLSFCSPILQSGEVTVPLKDSSRWISLVYKNIPATSFRHEDDQLKIHVKATASPHVFAFEKPLNVESIKIRGFLVSAPTIDMRSSETDDFLLRYGVARAGSRKLNVFERALAPDWILKLNEISQNLGVGLGELQLRLLSYPSQPAWQQRVHPQSDLIKEQRGLLISRAGPFEDVFVIPKGEELSTGLWISADGDATGASFQINISEITLELRGDSQ